MKIVNLHRHSMYSIFDGFGKPKDAAKYADEIGQEALAVTDHGTITGLIDHYESCKDYGIKPILGVEGYFQPEFWKNKDKYHITLIAKNLDGYCNLMKLQTEASKSYYYRNPIFIFELLKRYNEGLICMSACVGGYIAQLAVNGDDENHNEIVEAVNKFKKIYGEDYYLEVLPIDIDEQYVANRRIVRVGNETNTKIVITDDSHFVEPEQYKTYQIMHAMRNNEPDFDYSRRYMPTTSQIKQHWDEMHPEIKCDKFIKNTNEVADKCDIEFNFGNMIPDQEWDKPSKKKLCELAKRGLVDKGKWNNKYKHQLKKELSTVFHHGFEDYFLLTYDIVQYAKSNEIKVGPGRGSVCGSLLAYALGITDVDSIKVGTHFERFLRKEKKKFPDIDTDFDSNDRDEVIGYLLQKYSGKSAQIANYGLFKERNLMNDLAKVLDISDGDLSVIKKRLQALIDGGECMPLKKLRNDHVLSPLDKKYDFLKHFCRLYNNLRYIGKHAAGVAITPDDITNYVALQKYKGKLQTAYDLNGLEKLNVLKMDILGLNTLSIISDCEDAVDDNVEFNSDMVYENNKVYDEFSKGNTTGVFQFEKGGARDVLKQVKPSNFQELIACNALNRPAPKELGLVEDYAKAKKEGIDESKPWAEYTKDTYGCMIFQEQVMELCRELGELNWDETDTIMKSLGEADELKPKFVNGAVKNGLKKEDAEKMFDNMTLYLFNKAHGAGYSMLSFYCMWLKINYPTEFYYALLKNESRDHKISKYTASAVQNDIVVMLPHVNGGADFILKEIEGDIAIQAGLNSIKGIGTKTANKIVELGPYKSEEDFYKKVPKRYANKKVREKLKDEGALVFDKKIYWRRVVKYNAFLDQRELSFY